MLIMTACQNDLKMQREKNIFVMFQYMFSNCLSWMCTFFFLIFGVIVTNSIQSMVVKMSSTNTSCNINSDFILIIKSLNAVHGMV